MLRLHFRRDLAVEDDAVATLTLQHHAVAQTDDRAHRIVSVGQEDYTAAIRRGVDGDLDVIAGAKPSDHGEFSAWRNTT
jgi:hypothetical protein